MVGSRTLFFKPEASLGGRVMTYSPVLGQLGTLCMTVQLELLLTLPSG